MYVTCRRNDSVCVAELAPEIQTWEQVEKVASAWLCDLFPLDHDGHAHHDVVEWKKTDDRTGPLGMCPGKMPMWFRMQRAAREVLVVVLWIADVPLRPSRFDNSDKGEGAERTSGVGGADGTGEEPDDGDARIG